MRHSVPIRAHEGLFVGLAKQNLLFHQCVAELVDNAIAASVPEEPFKIHIMLNRRDIDQDVVDVYVVDSGLGMTDGDLERALQPGHPPNSDDRLNEHGFGLKNALATLSGGNGTWQIWTRPKGDIKIWSVQGPFRTEMEITDEEPFPSLELLPDDVGTVVHVPVRLSFVQTVQGRGAPATDLATLRDWLLEHLGVYYRGYLSGDAGTGDPSGRIWVCVGSDKLRVPPVHVPFANRQTVHFEVELKGRIYKLQYQYGTLDPEQRDRAAGGSKCKFYYQGNIPTQGIDIRLGKRVIATRQLETIWKHEDGERPIARHNNFNDFVGELLIPDVPRGVLTTVNNKTDFNLDDPEWHKIFEKLQEFRPVRNVREVTEEHLRREWIRMIRATNPRDTVIDDRSVWPVGARIDVYRKTSAGDVIIYEVKVGSATPVHLYQLKMYWDGLVLDGEKPVEGVLLVESYSSRIEEMLRLMNGLTPPTGSNPYKFRLEKHADVGLRQQT